MTSSIPLGTEPYEHPVSRAVRLLGATPADLCGLPVSGLWSIPGHPELTTGQLLTLAQQRIAATSFLPEGLRFREGHYYHDCNNCGQETEWEEDPDDFELGHRTNVCGRSERCLP